MFPTTPASAGRRSPRVLEAYLLSHRGAMAPVVAEAIASLPLPADGTVLDAGTGAGGALRPLAAAVPQGRVRGVDVDPRVLALAAREVADGALETRVELRAVDVATALTDAPAGGDVLPGRPRLERLLFDASERAVCGAPILLGLLIRARRPGEWL